ncbi:MAG: alkyl hydroperoxide reductase subunit F [Rikenellaceae bacterium]
MLDRTTKEQLREIFSGLSSEYTLLIERGADHPQASEIIKFLSDVADSSPKINLTVVDGEAIQFTIVKDGAMSGVVFRAIPNGHEFSSLILAILNLDGKGKNLPNNFTSERIKRLKGSINLTTYMSLSCTNCPDVVQSLNVMAILNPQIRHEAVDGSLYQEEVNELGIQSVPSVYADGELLHVGRGSIADLLTKLETKYGTQTSAEVVTHTYDVAIAGAGPAGVTAALYLARKGLSVAIVAERIGGQVNETSAIENITSIPSTSGSKLASDLRQHIADYPTIEILDNRTIESVEQEARIKRLQIKGGEVVESEILIIATGAEWRKLDIEGETECIGRGVAFCPHCDGPLFEGKIVAVVGGGNSGVEAAIDLAGVCKRVYLIEFMESLKADSVLQERLQSIENIEIFTNYQTTKILGNGSKVIAIEAKNRSTEELRFIELDGIFIQIGLSANSAIVKNIVNLNRSGEIEVDRNGRTSETGIYAAGDVTDVSYKQIIISMGEGAKAALAAFDDRIRGNS